MSSTAVPARVPPDSPFGAALERQRSIVNGRLERARRLDRRLDGDRFLAFLTEHGGPVVTAVAGVDPAATDRVLLAVVDAGLLLVAGDLLSERYPLQDLVWRRLLPSVPSLVAAAPEKVIASLGNAAWHLSRAVSPERGVTWVSRMAEIGRSVAAGGVTAGGVTAGGATGGGATGGGVTGGGVTAGEPSASETAPRDLSAVAVWLQAGQVLAWRAGMAGWRESAIVAWRGLPEALQRRSLGVEAEDPGPSIAELEAALADPWCPVAKRRLPRRLSLVGHVGGFTGLEGVFSSPPTVAVVEGRIVAWDQGAAFVLHADCYGHTLTRATVDRVPPAMATGDFAIGTDGSVRLGAQQLKSPVLVGASSAAAVGPLLAVTIPRSYRIYLVALTPVVAEPRA